MELAEREGEGDRQTDRVGGRWGRDQTDRQGRRRGREGMKDRELLRERGGGCLSCSAL